ncbi:MAG: DUF1015 domain-containing protein [Caldilineales bacterium]|nr:DUF1015 domain-containing protein [Caldilineales bacterium]
MAEVLPFRGWRYAPDMPLDEVLAPPYDVIGADQRREFSKRHANNVVRLTLPQLDETAAFESVYEQAASLYREWQGEGILRQDESPALYLLRQHFRMPHGEPATRLGFIGRLRLRPWGDGILPHEQTFPQAKADRLALLEATGFEDNPIFTLYRDPQGEVQSLLDQVVGQSPTAAYRDGHGVVHEMWMVQEPMILQTLTTFMAQRILYVADGHHRYETALNYQARSRQRQGDGASPAPYDYVLAYFAAMEDPGTVILPAHRLVVRGRLPDFDTLVRNLGDDFDMTSLGDDAALISAIQSAEAGQPLFGLITAGHAPQLLELKGTPDQQARLLAENPAPVADLPAAILQTLILGPYFNVPSEPQAQKAQLQFEPDIELAAAHVRAYRAKAALLTTATSMEQLRRIADAGEVAPPKATYFYPKLPSGMVFYSVR